MDNDTTTRAARVAALGLSLLLPACEAATNAANGAGAFAERTAERVEQKGGDAAITLAVTGVLVKDKDVQGTRITVSASGGIVTLRGTQSTPAAKARAETLATQVQGVAKVVNEIEVGP